MKNRRHKGWPGPPNGAGLGKKAGFEEGRSQKITLRCCICETINLLRGLTQENALNKLGKCDTKNPYKTTFQKRICRFVQIHAH